MNFCGRGKALCTSAYNGHCLQGFICTELSGVCSPTPPPPLKESKLKFKKYCLNGFLLISVYALASPTCAVTLVTNRDHACTQSVQTVSSRLGWELNYGLVDPSPRKC